jgi:hypothetical protein
MTTIMMYRAEVTRIHDLLRSVGDVFDFHFSKVGFICYVEVSDEELAEQLELLNACSFTFIKLVFSLISKVREHDLSMIDGDAHLV